MQNDAFKPAGQLGGAIKIRPTGPGLQGGNLGEHFRMQGSPQVTQPMGPRSIKDGGAGRFQPAADSSRMGQVMPTAPMGAEGRAIAPERHQQTTKFQSAGQVAAPKQASGPSLGTPAAAAPPTASRSSILVTAEALGPDGVTYSAPHIVDFPVGSKVLGVKYEPYGGE